MADLHTRSVARNDHASNASSENRGVDELSSSDSEHASHQRLDVSRAVSECSSTDNEYGVGRVLCGLNAFSSWTVEDLKLEMDVLEAEYNLLRARKKLPLQNRNGGCVPRNNAASHETQALCVSSDPIPMEGETKGDHCSVLYKIQPKATASSLCEDMGDMLCSHSRFAQEALERLREFSCEDECRMPQEDPTCALQDRLQKLLLAEVLEHECPVHCSFQRGCEVAWDTSDKLGAVEVQKDAIWKNLSEGKACLNDSVAHRKELYLRSWKDEQAKVALASPKEKFCYCLRKRSQQTLAEEMYCKETIRRIVQQVESEMEQWSQMQDILHNLQRELEGLSGLQKLWEDRALRAEAQLKCYQEEVHEWRCRAWSFEEELVMLRCEKQILKNKIYMIEDAQMEPAGIAREVLEKPRYASVGTHDEDFAVCESFVHSRNESGRSSVDLGTSSTQRSFHKSIKKSLDFVSSSNSSKFLFGNLGLPKGEPTGVQFSSKKVDVADCKGKFKSSKPSGQFIKLNTLKQDSCESTDGHDHKERKKARLFASSKENRQANASLSALNPSIWNEMQDGLPLGNVIHVPGCDYTSNLFATKPKSSWPPAPQSTPSRIPFGEIVNLSRHVKN